MTQEKQNTTNIAMLYKNIFNLTALVRHESRLKENSFFDTPYLLQTTLKAIAEDDTSPQVIFAFRTHLIVNGDLLSNDCATKFVLFLLESLKDLPRSLLKFDRSLRRLNFPLVLARL